VGGSEDFCSREHRNQYRLHRGLERLGELAEPAKAMQHRDLFKPLPRPVGLTSGGPRIPDLPRTVIDRPHPPVFEPRNPDRLALLPKSETLRGLAPHMPPATKAREFLILRRPPQAGCGRYTSRINPLARPQMNRAWRAIAARLAPKKGLTPRVSLGVRFRPPRVPARQFEIGQGVGTYLNGREILHGPVAFDSLSTPRTFSAPTSQPREKLMPLSMDDSRPRILHLEIRRGEFGARFTTLTPSAKPSAAEHRILLAPFAPQDPKTTLTVEDYQTK